MSNPGTVSEAEEETAAPDGPRDGALVELTLNVDIVNLMGTAYDIEGKTIAMPHKIVLEPQFFSPAASIKLATAAVKSRVTGSESEVSRVSLNLAGGDGKIRAISASAAVIPKFMGNKPAKPAKPAAPKEPPSDAATEDEEIAGAE